MCSVYLLIWNTDLPLSAREQCVRSMVNLFRDLFATEPLDSAVQMWWDSLCYDWHCGNRSRLRGGEDLSMQNVMFDTLVEILALDSEHCQGAALHGLGSFAPSSNGTNHTKLPDKASFPGQEPQRLRSCCCPV